MCPFISPFLLSLLTVNNQVDFINYSLNKKAEYMALEEFEKEPLSERDKSYLRMRSMMDYGMGLMWFAMGIFLIFIEHFDTGLEARFDESVMKIFGTICLLYGSFRIYRGYKKNYLRER